MVATAAVDRHFGSGSGTGGEPGWAGYAGAKEPSGLSKVAALEWGATAFASTWCAVRAESRAVKRQQFARTTRRRAGQVRSSASVTSATSRAVAFGSA